MTVMLDLNPSEEQELSHQAAREGLSLPEYIRRRLLGSPPDPLAPLADHSELSPLEPLPAHLVGTKPFNVMQFAGIAPRSAEETAAHITDIEAGREEWDARPSVKEQLLALRPKSTPEWVKALRPLTPSTDATNGLHRLVGAWPGDETDEEIERLLKQIDDEDAGRVN